MSNEKEFSLAPEEGTDRAEIHLHTCASGRRMNVVLPFQPTKNERRELARALLELVTRLRVVDTGDGTLSAEDGLSTEQAHEIEAERIVEQLLPDPSSTAFSVITGITSQGRRVHVVFPVDLSVPEREAMASFLDLVAKNRLREGTGAGAGRNSNLN
jgi:hypothetical protein